MDIKDFAEMILKSQTIREESYDQEKEEREVILQSNSISNFDVFYTKTIMQSCKEVIANTEVEDKFDFIFYLLNKLCWNDVQDWAENIIEESKLMEVK